MLSESWFGAAVDVAGVIRKSGGIGHCVHYSEKTKMFKGLSLNYNPQNVLKVSALRN